LPRGCPRPAATIDGIGNVFGSSAKPAPKLLAGSHLESQNYAGWLDDRSASSMRAEMLFQIRDDDLAVIARLEERLRRWLPLSAHRAA